MKKVLLVRENGTHMMIKKVTYEGSEAEARRKIVSNMDMTKVYIQKG